jgi:hypothetical protein
MGYDPESPENLGIAIRRSTAVAPPVDPVDAAIAAWLASQGNPGPQQGYTWSAFDDGSGYWQEREIGPDGQPTGRVRSTTSRVSSGGGGGAPSGPNFQRVQGGDGQWYAVDMDNPGAPPIPISIPGGGDVGTSDYQRVQGSDGKYYAVDMNNPAAPPIPIDVPGGVSGGDNPSEYTINGQRYYTDWSTGTPVQKRIAAEGYAGGYQAPDAANSYSSYNSNSGAGGGISIINPFNPGALYGSGGGSGSGSDIAKIAAQSEAYSQNRDADLAYQQAYLALKNEYDVKQSQIDEAANLRAEERQAYREELDRRFRYALAKLDNEARGRDQQRADTEQFMNAVGSVDPGRFAALMAAKGTTGQVEAAGGAVSDAALYPAASALYSLRNPAGAFPSYEELFGGAGGGWTPPVVSPGPGAPPPPATSGAPAPAPGTGAPTIPINPPPGGGSRPGGAAAIQSAATRAQMGAINDYENQLIAAYQQMTGRVRPGLTAQTRADGSYDQWQTEFLNWRKAQEDAAYGKLSPEFIAEFGSQVAPGELDPSGFGMDPNGPIRLYPGRNGVGIVMLDTRTGSVSDYRPGGAMPGNEAKPLDVLGSQGLVVQQIANPLAPPPIAAPDPTIAPIAAVANQGAAQTAMQPQIIPYGNDNIVNGIPQMANGGTVSGPAIVGEKGPELLIPGTSGQMEVIPFSKIPGMARGGTVAAAPVDPFYTWLSSLGLSMSPDGTYRYRGQRLTEAQMRAQYQAETAPPVAPVPAPAPAPAPVATAPVAPTPVPVVPVAPVPAPTTPAQPASPFYQPGAPASGNTGTTAPIPGQTANFVLPEYLADYGNQVRDIRESVQYPALNLMDPAWDYIDPTVRNVFTAGRQTEFGIPEQSTLFEQKKWQPKGFASLSLGL